VTDNLIKHRRVWKDEVSKLQYANAVYIERIAVLERQNSDLFSSITHVRNEYEILYNNVSRLFGSADNFTKRGATLPKQLEENIKTVISDYKTKERESNERSKSRI
jgi:hypothetical protein